MILDGKTLKQKILDENKKIINDNNYKIKLAIILVGNNEASKIYIKNKKIACNYVGIKVDKYLLDEETKEEDLIKLINKLNSDNEVTGINLQSPVPRQIDFNKCSGLINAKKDVDGFTKENIYNLYLGVDTILPCTVKGIIKLLEEYKIKISGENVVIVGRGNIVGHPLSLAMLNKDATVTIAHSKTKNLKDITKKADILISATGIPHLIKEDMIKENATIIDVGVAKIDGKIVGDVDFLNVSKKAKYITPNPGGVGPMTVAMIIDNLIFMYERGINNG